MTAVTVHVSVHRTADAVNAFRILFTLSNSAYSPEVSDCKNSIKPYLIPPQTLFFPSSTCLSIVSVE